MCVEKKKESKIVSKSKKNAKVTKWVTSAKTNSIFIQNNYY